MRLNLKLVNEELGRRGYDAELAKGRGYFFFRAGEADEWIDSTVPVRTINTLTLKKWIEEFRRLRSLNAQIMRTAKSGRSPKE
jgi:hypothetical protein